jgi:hypothetical protein
MLQSSIKEFECTWPISSRFFVGRLREGRGVCRGGGGAVVVGPGDRERDMVKGRLEGDRLVER